jgi:hypothetical protein
MLIGFEGVCLRIELFEGLEESVVMFVVGV